MASDYISNYSSCYAKIFIGGNEVDSYRVRNIVSLSIAETISGADLCTVVINDTEGAYLDDDVFVENVPITVELSDSATNVVHQFNGFIASIDVNFSEFVEMTITCMDNSFLLDREKKENTWENVSSYDIVNEILSSYGISLQTPAYDNFQVQETISQSSQTDLDFILSMLDSEDVPCYFKIVDLETAIYDKMDFTKDAFIGLTYRSYPYEIVNLSMQVDRDQLLEAQTDADISTKDNSVIGGSTNIYITSPITTGLKAIASASPINVGYNGIVENSSDFVNDADIQSKVDRYIMNNELMVLTGEMEVLVTPDTNNTYVGDVINLYGLGINLTGGYLVTDISRDVSSAGYTLNFSVAKTGFGGLANLSSEATTSTDSGTVTTHDVTISEPVTIADAFGEEITITPNGITTLSQSDLLTESEQRDAIEAWAEQYFADKYTYYYERGNMNYQTELSVIEATEQALANYMEKLDANNTYVASVGGNFKANTNHLEDSSYTIGYVYTVPNMSIFDLAYRLNINSEWHNEENAVLETGTKFLNQFGLMKAIVMNNVELFSRIIGFEYYNDGTYLVLDSVNMNILNLFLHTDYARDWLLPIGTRISLELFDGDQIMTNTKASRLLGSMQGAYLVYPRENYNEAYNNAVN